MSTPLSMAVEMAERRGDRAMAGYYFVFDSTGVPEIDLILATVAAAGKAYHSTEYWGDSLVDDEAISHIDMIQAAASEAARNYPQATIVEVQS